MAIAGEIAATMGFWTSTEMERQQNLITKTGLPTQLPSMLDVEAILETLKSDKKVKAGKVRFVLPLALGNVTITDEVPPDILRQVLQSKLSRT